MFTTQLMFVALWFLIRLAIGFNGISKTDVVAVALTFPASVVVIVFVLVLYIIINIKKEFKNDQI